MNDSRPLYRLTRHFFTALFDLGFLSDAGSESFERMIIGVCALFVSFGLLLVRIFMAQYRHLTSLPTPEPFRQALLGADSFVMALPMWIVAFVTVLVSHALFPDETDFRILIPLPINKRLVFEAKLLALAAFCGLFIISTHVALTPLIVVLSMGRWAQHAPPVRMAAFFAASATASVWAVLLVTSVNGLLVLAASRGRLMSAAAWLRSGMLAALVLAIPFLGRLPANGPQFSGDATSIYASPSAWFVGLEQLLLGHPTPQFLRLSGLAMAGLAVTMAVTTGTYALLYRHFERVTRRPAGGSPRIGLERQRRRLPALGRGSGYVAVRSFIGVTLRRSALHQGVLVFIGALGAGLVLNSVVGLDLAAARASGQVLRTSAAFTVIWDPFALMFFMSVAARSALTLPTEQRANWIFRMTEESSVRRDALRATRASIVSIGVLLPVLVLAPAHWLLFGGQAAISLPVTFLWGLLFVEILLKNWDRIPFSCSYIPGKRFIPQSLLIGASAFLLMTGFGSAVVLLNLSKPTAGPVPDTIVLAAVLILRRQRLALWRDHPLLFEDVLPTEVNPLRLSGD
jgi:hypothetical protein